MVNSPLRFILIALTAFFLLGCQQEEVAQGKLVIGIVNQEKAYRESDVAKAAVAHLDALSRELQNELTTLQAEAKKNKNKDKGQEQFEAGFNELQQRFAAEQQLVTTKVFELFEKSVEATRAELGISIVFTTDAALTSDPAADITDQVIAEMNKDAVDFNETPAEEKSTDVAETPTTNDEKIADSVPETSTPAETSADTPGAATNATEGTPAE